MNTLEVLRFLELQGFRISSWKLQRLIKRGVISKPVKVYKTTMNGEYHYPANVISRIKMFLILEACQKNKQVIRGGIVS
jgi:hypothetical protein